MRPRFIHIRIQLYGGNRDYVVGCPAHSFAAGALYFLSYFLAVTQCRYFYGRNAFAGPLVSQHSFSASWL